LDTAGLTSLEQVGHAFLTGSPRVPEPLTIPSARFTGIEFRRDGTTGFVPAAARP
jgi:hypothetical protein